MRCGLTKLTHFLAVWMTFTLQELCRLYIREIVRLHGVLVSIVSNMDPRFTTLLEKFPKGYGDTIDDEYCVSSVDKWSIRENHTGFRGHAASMCLGS